MTFTPDEAAACARLVEWALEEDLGTAGDVTSQATIPADLQGRAAFVARAAGVAAGLPAVGLVLAAVDARLHGSPPFLMDFQPRVADGSSIQPGEQLATVSGPMRSILAAERTALNFLQRLSGVATRTRQYVEAVAALPCRVLDTRKTTPGWRLLEKYAVRCGGGHNHRVGLYDGILIKDNHLAATAEELTIPQAVRRVRETPGVGKLPLEIEVDTLEQLNAALASLPDIVLLDNMSLEQMREAVWRRNGVAPQVLLEASGGVTLDTVRAIAEAGVDRVSVGALTHSAPALDVALDYLQK